MTIIQENADCMPNEFRNSGRKPLNNLLVLPTALNWNHMRDICNSLLILLLTLHLFFINISQLHAFIVYSTFSKIIWYRRSTDLILIQFFQLSLLQQSARCNVKPVLHSTFSVMKKKLFKHVEVKAPNNNFSGCSECDFLQDCISKYPRGCNEWACLVD